MKECDDEEPSVRSRNTDGMIHLIETRTKTMTIPTPTPITNVTKEATVCSIRRNTGRFHEGVFVRDCRRCRATTSVYEVVEKVEVLLPSPSLLFAYRGQTYF